MSNTQNQIICPECNTAFSLDESHYALISQQVRTKEFNKELDKKVQLELTKSLKIKENELTTKHTEKLNQKDKILTQLRNDLKLKEEQNKNHNQALIEKKDKEIHSFKSMLKLQETQNQIKINEAVKLKDQEINQLKNNIKLQDSKNQIQTQEVIDSKEKEIIELKNKIKNLDDKQRISDLELNKKYSGQITLLKEEIHRIKNFQSSLTKEIGEDLEKYCATEFEILRQDAYRNAQFVKDNNLVNGTKGDYIFRDFDEDGDEITSIMFDMKNEREESKNKSKNSKFYEKLNKDRINKKCEYAVLVSTLEKDNALFNKGIVEVVGDYENMFVVRPQFFTLIISILRNTSKKKLKDKRELQLAKENNLNYSVLSENMNLFRDACLTRIQTATGNYKQAIKFIDEAVKKLLKVRELFVDANNNLELASEKVNKFDIENMTDNNKKLEEHKEEEEEEEENDDDLLAS